MAAAAAIRMNVAQNLASSFGKILRIDPLGNNSANGKYGIPKDNPFVNDNDPNTLGEIYAYGARNPQRFAWDSKTGTMYMADIGQGIAEEVTTVPKGANLGWRVWEGSFRFVNGSEVSLDTPRSDPKVTYPVVEFAQLDPLLQNSSAVTMGYVYRHDRLKKLSNLLLFGDNPSGEMFYVNVDKLPRNGGQDAIRRIVFNDKGQTKNLFDLVKARTAAQGKKPPTRADLRYGEGPDGRIFILNKWDGVIREIVNSSFVSQSIRRHITQTKRGSAALFGAKPSRLGAVFGDREIVLHVFRANHVGMRLAGGALGQLRHLLV